jgi:hypothetical protein
VFQTHYLSCYTFVVKNQRHFPYKHPLFGRGKLARKGDNSVYYYWWAFLKRNADYLACCDAGGKGPLANLFEDFGDVRGESFKDWWQQGGRGVRLFAEPVVERIVEVLEPGMVIPPTDETLSVSFPLNLPKRFLQSRLKDLLKRYHSGKRGVLKARQSKAKYQITGQPNIPALKKTLQVWDALQDRQIQAGRRLPHWMIAKKLKLVPDDKMPQPNDPPYEAELRRSVMSATVGRYKKRAQELIVSTSMGRFV